MQFGVFGFGFVEQRDVGVSIFPVGEKVLIGDAGLRLVALFLKHSAQFELGDHEHYVRATMRFHVHDFLKILLRLSVAASLLIRNTSGVKDTGVGASINRSGVQKVDGLCRVVFAGIGRP